MPPYTVNFGGASQPPRYTKTGPENNVNISHKIRKDHIIRLCERKYDKIRHNKIRYNQIRKDRK